MTPEEQEELSRLVVSFYFSRMSPKVRSAVYPRIKDSMDELSRSDSDESHRVKKELCYLRDSLKAKRQSASSMIDPEDVHGHYKYLHDYISRLVGDAIDESFAHVEEQLNELKKENRKKENQKRLAILAGTVSTLLTVAATLVVRYVGN